MRIMNSNPEHIAFPGILTSSIKLENKLGHNINFNKNKIIQDTQSMILSEKELNWKSVPKLFLENHTYLEVQNTLYTNQ